MRAVEITSAGGPAGLKVQEREACQIRTIGASRLLQRANAEAAKNRRSGGRRHRSLVTRCSLRCATLEREAVEAEHFRQAVDDGRETVRERQRGCVRCPGLPVEHRQARPRPPCGMRYQPRELLLSLPGWLARLDGEP